MTRDEARKRAWMLYRDLRATAERDAEQEVRGILIPVLDTCLQVFREHVADDPIVNAAIDGLMSPEVIADGYLRAVDAFPVVGQLAIALGPERQPATASSPQFSTSSPGLFSNREQF